MSSDTLGIGITIFTYIYLNLHTFGFNVLNEGYYYELFIFSFILKHSE